MKSMIVSACAVMAGFALALAPQAASAGVVGEYNHQCAATLPESLSVPITAAGHTWLAVGGLDAASLQGLDALVIRYCGTYPGSAAVDAAVAGGMGLVLDATSVDGNLPGGPALSFNEWCDQNHSLAPASPIATGPGGTLTNDSLDVGGPGGMGGYCTFTGTTAKATLPSGLIPFVTTADGSRVGALGYSSGAGRVALSKTQFSYPTVYTPSEYLYPGAKTYYINALTWALSKAPPVTCASEGYTGTQLTWCKNICEMGYTGTTLKTWIKRWTDKYRSLPYCAREN